MLQYEGKLIDLSAFQSCFNFRNIMKMHLAFNSLLVFWKAQKREKLAFWFHDGPVEMHR